MTLQPNTRIGGGRYIVQQVLSQKGAFGITYKGFRTADRTPVCIKELYPIHLVQRNRGMVIPVQGKERDWDAAKRRFHQEGRDLLKFHHPGIVRVLELFDENNTSYMVQEYIDGQTLEDLLTRGPLPESEAVSYIIKAAEALEVVHKEGMIHRDLKPGNIMLAKDGRVVLIDFGAAKEFVGGQSGDMSVVLTPGYAPLEQYRTHGRREAYTDIYALGATLYHLVTGGGPLFPLVPAPDRPPAGNVALPPPRSIQPSISASVETAILRAMEMDARRRPQSALDFAKALGARSKTTPGPSGTLAAPALIADRRLISLGAIEERHSKVEIVRIQNVGEEHFSGWVELASGSDWLKVEPTTITLRPKQSLDLMLTAYPPSGPPGQAHRETVSIRTQRGAELTVDVAAVSPEPVLSVDESAIIVGTRLGQKTSRYLSIENAGTATVEGQIREDPPVAWLDARPTEFQLEPGGSLTVTVTLDSEGAFFGTSYRSSLWVRSNGGDHKIEVEMRVEDEESAFRRFRIFATGLTSALGVSIGLLAAAISPGGSGDVAEALAILSVGLIGIIGGREGYKRGGWQPAFWYGLGAGGAAVVTFLIAGAMIAVEPLSAIAWGAIYGSLTWLFARPLFKEYIKTMRNQGG